jgi:hypothetical protein
LKALATHPGDVEAALAAQVVAASEAAAEAEARHMVIEKFRR